MSEIPKIEFPLKIELKRSRAERVITIDRTRLKVCEPKIEAEWSWTRLKTRKFIVHLQRNGRIKISDILVRKRHRRK